MAQHQRILGISAACVLSMLLPSLSRAGTWVAFQNSYTRGTGSPVTVTSTFTLLNRNTQYTLKAYNGGLQNDTTELVSNSVVFLNGAQIVGPSNFNQSVAEVNVTIFPGLTNTLSVQVRGKPGGVLTIQVIGVDNDPPTITASVSPSPNAAGWNNSPVTVTFTCSDKTSGVASCPLPVTVGKEGANQVVSGTATDLAGNTASTSVTINLDMTSPTITGSINPPPDAGGYNSGPVTVTFNCADALSGVASCSPAVSVSGEGSFPESGTAVDVAGNTASTTVTVNISFNYFKIRSWQTNPAGDPAQTGKCLDYGTSPSGASVFLNDCVNAHSIRVKEINRNIGGAPSYEVMLFAGNLVIGIHNPPLPPANSAPTSTSAVPTPTASSPLTEYALELQYPFTSIIGSRVSSSANQIFRLDGDSIILEVATPNPVPSPLSDPGPCINTVSSTTLCPAPPPQLVIQVQNARGTNGSPLVAALRNLSDNEFWDFVATDGSGRFPTNGFISMVAPAGAPATPITTNWQLWNAICAPQVVPLIAPPAISVSGVPLLDISTNPGTAVACTPSVVWGNVVVVAGNDPNECTGSYVPAGVGPCIDLSFFPPITLPAGVTIRGDRRGANFGPQLFDHFPTGLPSKPVPPNHCEWCMVEVQGDYVRVTGLRLRGQSRATDQSEPGTEGINVGYPGQPPGSPTFAPTTMTELISTIDHNDMSDWGAAAITIADAYSAVDPTDNDATNQSCTFTVAGGSTSYPCTTISDENATLANVHVARNFLHHNQRDNDGYGVEVGRALIEGNTFAWDRHAIASGGEPHNEYRAAYNLVLSVKSTGDQDFDMHGINHPGHGYGGPGGYYVNILGNTFLGTNRQNYWLRGNPIVNNDFDGNVSLRNETDAIHFVNGYDDLLRVLCCTHTYPGPPFPINLSGNQFADSSPPYTDPTTRLGPASLGVGDFDGDGDDDLLLTTGASWYYSPAGAREWRFLSAKVDRIDTLLLGDFDGDGRTDVVGMNPSGQFDVSWGGVSDWEVINQSPCVNGVPNPCPTSIQNMVVGDFDGDGKPDILYTDKVHWYISYGGTMPFTQVNDSSFLVQDLRFGHFAICGTGAETDVFSVQNTGWYVSCGATTPWQLVGAALTKTVLMVADFNGDGSADVLAPSPDGWQISYGGSQPLTDVPQPFGAFTFLAVAGVGHFTGQPQTDVLVWNGLGIVPIVTGTELLLSAAGLSPVTAYGTQDMR